MNTFPDKLSLLNHNIFENFLSASTVLLFFASVPLCSLTILEQILQNPTSPLLEFVMLGFEISPEAYSAKVALGYAGPSAQQIVCAGLTTPSTAVLGFCTSHRCC